MTAREGRYRHGGEATEDFRLGGDRLEISLRRGRGAAVLSCAARFDGERRVASLELSKADGVAPARAAYRWDGDDWVGRVETGGAAVESVLPMVAGLELLLPFAAFEGPFLRRLNLPTDSQRRVEVVWIAPERLEAVQSHVIVERLGDEGEAERYRWTDAEGRQHFLRLRGDLVLERTDADGGVLYRLEAGPQSV